MIHIYLIFVGKREYCADVIFSQCTLFQITVPLSYELELAVSDSETEEDTQDFTLTNEDGDEPDPGRPAGSAGKSNGHGHAASSPHGRSRGDSYSRETRAL